MKKAADLRQHLSQWVPDLKRNPDKLSLFIEKGRIASKVGASLSYRYHYALQILVTDFAEPIDVITVPLLAWIATNQPDLLQNPDTKDQVFRFQAEILDNDKADISITLELSERVIVSATDAGYSCTHIGEPPLPDLTGPTPWQIYLKGELIAEGPGPG